MTQALIFDVDGTLADTEDVHRQAFNQAFAAFGLDWQWDPALYTELLRITGGKERIAGYLRGLDLPQSERQRLQRLIPGIHGTKTRLYRDLLEHGQVPLRAGVLRLAREARSAGVRLGIASTTSPENIEPLLTAGFGAGSLEWFATIATGDVVEHKKPAPDIYHVALESLGLGPAAAIAIEDSAIGVRAAKAAGLFTVATPSRWTLEQDFSGADLVLESLGDPQEPLSAADERHVGGRYLSLERLLALHAARGGGGVHAETH